MGKIAVVCHGIGYIGSNALSESLLSESDNARTHGHANTIASFIPRAAMPPNDDLIDVSMHRISLLTKPCDFTRSK
jgi:hypothetical protein